MCGNFCAFYFNFLEPLYLYHYYYIPTQSMYTTPPRSILMSDRILRDNKLTLVPFATLAPTMGNGECFLPGL